VNRSQTVGQYSTVAIANLSSTANACRYTAVEALSKGERDSRSEAVILRRIPVEDSVNKIQYAISTRDVSVGV
jgi:hypothetical protein